MLFIDCCARHGAKQKRHAKKPQTTSSYAALVSDALLTSCETTGCSSIPTDMAATSATPCAVGCTRLTSAGPGHMPVR